MKKVPISKVAEKKWKVKKGDRASLNSAKTAVNTSAAVKNIESMAVRQVEILEVLAQATQGLVTAARMPTAPQEQPKIEVKLPRPERVKRRIRFKAVRNQEGFIDYVDMIEME